MEQDENIDELAAFRQAKNGKRFIDVLREQTDLLFRQMEDPAKRSKLVELFAPPTQPDIDDMMGRLTQRLRALPLGRQRFLTALWAEELALLTDGKIEMRRDVLSPNVPSGK